MALDIKWERPDQRLCLAVTAPLFVDLGQQRLRVIEWSLEGFQLKAPGVGIAPGVGVNAGGPVNRVGVR